MKRIHAITSALLLLVLLAGCSVPQLSRITPTPAATSTPAITATPQPTATLTPTNTPTPTATWVPTLTPPPPTPTPEASPELLEAMDAIETEITLLRGLEETSPITRSLMTREELAVYMEEQFAEEYPPGEVEEDVRVLAAFDFVPKDYDLHGLLVDLYSSQVAGFYDDEKDTLYVITDAGEGTFDILARVTFAHEYTHGLQDEHFDLDTFLDEDQLDDDHAMARLSLIEGDASLAMTEYLVAHMFEFTEEDMTALMGQDVVGGQEILDTAPPIVRETFLFPYFYGLEFVSTLQAEGWEAVDAAFADPPQSTEQILHPEKYLSRDEPQIVTLPPLTDTLGAGWRLVEAETLGEFQTGLYLAQQVEQATANLASEGWDGDQYAVYINGDADVLVFATAWDSSLDREEFVDAYIQYAVAKYDQPPTHQGKDEIWWETQTQAAVLTWKDNQALLVLGPDLKTVEEVLAAIRLQSP